MNILEMLDAVRSLPRGEYCEAGVWRGDTAVLIAPRIASRTSLFLVDSFEGHAAPLDGIDDTVGHPKGRYSDTSVERIQTLAPHAIILKGWIPDVFALLADSRFRFVHVDVDHYLPTRAACEFFVPRMVPGGIIRFDDYEAVRGATLAINEAIGRDRLLQGDWRYVAP